MAERSPGLEVAWEIVLEVERSAARVGELRTARGLELPPVRVAGMWGISWGSPGEQLPGEPLRTVPANFRQVDSVIGRVLERTVVVTGWPSVWKRGPPMLGKNANGCAVICWSWLGDGVSIFGFRRRVGKSLMILKVSTKRQPS